MDPDTGGVVLPDDRSTRLGDLLRQSRESQGISLSQAEARTRISRRHIEALESDRLSALPAPVFTRGLVRAYATFLGIDVAVALAALALTEARVEASGVQPTVVRPAELAAQSTTPVLRIALFVILVGVVGLIAYGVLPRYGSLVAASSVDAQTPAATPSVVVLAASASPAPSPTVAASPTPQPVVIPSATPSPVPSLAPEERATATAAAAMRGVQVEARARDRVWLQAEADGQVVFSGILQTTERKTWRAERRIALHIGDAGLVEVAHNGRALGTLGPRGEVIRREWIATR